MLEFNQGAGPVSVGTGQVVITAAKWNYNTGKFLGSVASSDEEGMRGGGSL